MAAILAPVKVLIASMEASEYPTSNLVKPYIGKMIDRLSPLKSTTTEYRGIKEIVKVSNHILPYVVIHCEGKDIYNISRISKVEEYHPKVAEFRELLRDQLIHRLTCEREGHLEDLLMITVLDPRFKNMDFKGSSG